MVRRMGILAVALFVVLIAAVVGISIMSNPDSSAVDARITTLVTLITAVAIPTIITLVTVTSHLDKQNQKLDEIQSTQQSTTDQNGDTDG